MEKLKILNRKIIKQGEGYFVYLPKAYFNNGQLDANEIYEIQIYPQKKVKYEGQKQKSET